MQIKFGTDGWRGIIADDFTYENVQIASQGIANWLRVRGTHPKDGSCGLRVNSKTRNPKPETRVIVSYDARFQAENFAKIVADVFAKNNIKVYLTSTDVPTPVAAFYIKHKKLLGGIIITASHNPPEFLGMKFKPYYAGSATSRETKEIEEEIQSIIRTTHDPSFGWVPRFGYPESARPTTHPLDGYPGLGTPNPQSAIKIIDPYAVYLSQLKRIVDFKKIREKKMKVIIDPMHGAGRLYLEKILKEAGCNVVNISHFRDVLFGGRVPEPILKNLNQLQRQCECEKKVGLAIDGDGDRIGAIDEKGRFLSSHYLGTLLLEYFYTYKKQVGSVIKSINFTSAIDILANKYNLKLHTVPVGFKYVCEIMRKEKVLIGMEESGGIAFSEHIPERDGILSALYLIEMLASYNLPLYKVFDNLYNKIGNFYYDRLDIKCSEEEKQKIYNYLKITKIKKIREKIVEKIDTIDGFKYYLAGGDWIMIRISGTEPVIRIYAEARKRHHLHNLLEWGRNL